MIHYITGNLLESDAEALVNTVNTVGVMGKGIALQFKNVFPNNFKNLFLLRTRHRTIVRATKRKKNQKQKKFKEIPTLFIDLLQNVNEM